ncbi:Hypothetical protein NGAL_HAMBI2605_62530 [Neorhizobium galegae bv. orientalis]|nr:Hypothetical protein NGAL_HAMBI2605_62530 [Neorhizobium galegae bv. orientalis]
MTTIQSMSISATAGRYAARERSSPDAVFNHENAGEAVSAAKLPSDKLKGLQEDLEALKKEQLNMPISDYLVAKFTLLEQITTEKLNAGEKLDVLGWQIEGRVFQIGGKRLDPGLLKTAELPSLEMAKVVKPEDRLRNLLAQQS